MPIDKYEKVERAYTFLHQKATNGTSFQVSDIMQATDWKRASVNTYIVKQWKDVLESDGRGTYKAKPEFRRLSLDDFKQLISQKRKIYSQYQRVEYSRAVNYEFLIPLTKEDKLRESLDDLFYTDTVRRRLQEMKNDEVLSIFPEEMHERKEDWLDRVAATVGKQFGGYSILHMTGRFRAADIKSRQEAAQLLLSDQKYLIDETTALVRFVIPLQSARRIDPALSGAFSFADEAEDQAVKRELRMIRWSFFNLFAEAIVRTIQGEDEIWLLEDTGISRRLYVWERS